jgi:hypothetical protein
MLRTRWSSGTKASRSTHSNAGWRRSARLPACRSWLSSAWGMPLQNHAPSRRAKRNERGRRDPTAHTAASSSRRPCIRGETGAKPGSADRSPASAKGSDKQYSPGDWWLIASIRVTRISRRTRLRFTVQSSRHNNRHHPPHRRRTPIQRRAGDCQQAALHHDGQIVIHAID